DLAAPLARDPYPSLFARRCAGRRVGQRVFYLEPDGSEIVPPGQALADVVGVSARITAAVEVDRLPGGIVEEPIASLRPAQLGEGTLRGIRVVGVLRQASLLGQLVDRVFGKRQVGRDV